MGNNELIQREDQARSIIKTKMSQMNLLVGNDKKKSSKFASAIIQLAQNDNLKGCQVDDIIDVAFQIVQAGLNPNPLFGQAYVVPYKGKAQLQIGYKGYVQLGYRSGWKFKAVPVYKCDDFNYSFGGFEDDIKLIPNYELRQEDNGNWVFSNLLGVIVYAKDNEDYIVTEFVHFRKLEQLRNKSPNQIQTQLKNIWLTWAEELYKAKAIKYVVSRLPIGDDINEALSKEDMVYDLDNAPKKSLPKKDLNALNKTNHSVEVVEIEHVEQKEAEPAKPKNLKEKLSTELVNRGATKTQTKNFVETLAEEEIVNYLNNEDSLNEALALTVGA